MPACRLRHLLMCCVCLLTGLLPTHAQTDSTALHCPAEQFKVQKLIMPTSIMAVGVFGINNGWFHKVRNDVRKGVGRWHDSPFHLDDYVQYLPVAANLGLRFTGLPARHSAREQVASTVTAYAVMGILSNGLKHTIHERRPDNSTCNSFPSGHASIAFMGAELVRQEYGTWPGVAAYSVATGVAFLRIYNDRHWLNDVIAGAGIGILSTHIAYWLLPWERRLLGWEKTSSLALLPTYDGYTAGLALSIELK